jgi:hypothetical protein
MIEKSTAVYIVRLLNCEVSRTKAKMMDCIDNGLDAFLKDRIAEYREALHARDGFCGWVDDQKFEEDEGE